jgi:glucose-1-phosphate thymidylyltransferase
MPMKGVILHGGHGTRLRPLTHTGPKQLIPVANKPISQYVLEEIVRSGVRDVAIVLGDTAHEKVKQHYGDGSKFGSRITYVEQGAPKGIAHAVGLCRDFVGEDRFVVYLGDNLLKGGIKQYVDRFALERTTDALLLLTKVRDPERFGVAKLDPKGRLIGLIEKPKEPPSNYALAGIYLFSPTIFEAISKLKPSWRSELEITEAIQGLLQEGKEVAYEIISGWWKDTGRPEDILEANRLILDDLQPDILGNVELHDSIQGRVSLGRGSVVKKGATIRGPAIIGQDTIIGPGVYIGPYTSIGNKCVIEKGEIENSIIMDYSTIAVEDRIVDSLVGPHSTLSSNWDAKPRGKKFVLGEGSSVTL